MNNFDQVTQVFANYIEREVEWYTPTIDRATMLSHFNDQLKRKETPEEAFRWVCEMFAKKEKKGGIPVHTMVASVFEELEKRTANYPAPEKDPIKRIAKHQSKLITNLSKCSIELDGIDVSEKMREMGTPVIPTCFLPKQEVTFKTFEATAHKTKGSVKLAIEVSV